MLEPLVVKATRAVPRRERRSNLSDLSNQGGGIIQDKIILPAVDFKTHVLINASFGNHINSIGGIPVGIRKKIWIVVILYTIISWCFGLYLIWIVFN